LLCPGWSFYILIACPKKDIPQSDVEGVVALVVLMMFQVIASNGNKPSYLSSNVWIMIQYISREKNFINVMECKEYEPVNRIKNR
jgi:hypothetical protein